MAKKVIDTNGRPMGRRAATKRNPQDTTLRNVRAAAKRDAAVSEQVGSLSTVVQDLTRRVEALEAHTRINMP